MPGKEAWNGASGYDDLTAPALNDRAKMWPCQVGVFDYLCGFLFRKI
jgi:hypothetical protein